MYHRNALQRDSGQVIEWWEERRFFYNKVVPAIGTLTAIFMILCGVISEPIVGEAIGLPDPLMLAPLGILAYGILANICYTGGWISELLLLRFGPGLDTAKFGLRAFRVGVKFSIALTLFPALLCWAAFVLAIATGDRIGRADQ